MKKIPNQKLTASVHYPGENNDNFLIESEKYSTKKDFKEALNKSGLVIIHISTERDLYEK
jgi:hypothetical protein|nr:MAG TPA: hypothetical protein [Caudoviricetes sp.]